VSGAAAFRPRPLAREGRGPKGHATGIATRFDVNLSLVPLLALRYGADVHPFSGSRHL